MSENIQKTSTDCNSNIGIINSHGKDSGLEVDPSDFFHDPAIVMVVKDNGTVYDKYQPDKVLKMNDNGCGDGLEPCVKSLFENPAVIRQLDSCLIIELMKKCHRSINMKTRQSSASGSITPESAADANVTNEFTVVRDVVYEMFYIVCHELETELDMGDLLPETSPHGVEDNIPDGSSVFDGSSANQKCAESCGTEPMEDTNGEIVTKGADTIANKHTNQTEEIANGKVSDLVADIVLDVVHGICRTQISDTFPTPISSMDAVLTKKTHTTEEGTGAIATSDDVILRAAQDIVYDAVSRAVQIVQDSTMECSLNVKLTGENTNENLTTGMHARREIRAPRNTAANDDRFNTSRKLGGTMAIAAQLVSAEAEMERNADTTKEKPEDSTNGTANANGKKVLLEKIEANNATCADDDIKIRKDFVLLSPTSYIHDTIVKGKKIGDDEENDGPDSRRDTNIAVEHDKSYAHSFVERVNDQRKIAVKVQNTCIIIYFSHGASVKNDDKACPSLQPVTQFMEKNYGLTSHDVKNTANVPKEGGRRDENFLGDYGWIKYTVTCSRERRYKPVGQIGNKTSKVNVAGDCMTTVRETEDRTNDENKIMMRNESRGKKTGKECKESKKQNAQCRRPLKWLAGLFRRA